MSYTGVMRFHSDDDMRKPVTVRIDERLLARLDRFAERQRPRVSRTAVVEAAVEKWLDEHEAPEKPRDRKGRK